MKVSLRGGVGPFASPAACMYCGFTFQSQIYSVFSNFKHSPQVMRFLRAAAKFMNPELLCQEEDGSLQAFRGEAYDIHQIKLQHVKKCKECQEMFLNPEVDLAEGEMVTGSHDN